MEPRRIAVIGGGAAGFFSAIAAADTDPTARGTVFESTIHPLTKVRISGGGRCNVTHACFEPRELVKRYPRGSRELIGPLNRFGPRDTVAWFQARGVELKTEKDGRMFPTTDDSGTIVDCLQEAARAASIALRLRMPVRELDRSETDGRFTLTLGDGSAERFDRVIVATGGTKVAGGFALAESVGHTIEPLAPSLFTFQINDERLRGLEGLAVPTAEAKVAGTKLCETGPVLVTHWGLSGPAILRLSAWGARELADWDYNFKVQIGWSGDGNEERVRAKLQGARNELGKKQIHNANPVGLPGRLWERLVASAGIAKETIWTSLPKPQLGALARAVAASEFQVTGKSTNKEEFVTCGGVRLKEIDFKKMESRICPGLHFAGEVLDIDGITGGFNFQSAWTTGVLSGRAAADA